MQHDGRRRKRQHIVVEPVQQTRYAIALKCPIGNLHPCKVAMQLLAPSRDQSIPQKNHRPPIRLPPLRKPLPPRVLRSALGASPAAAPNAVTVAGSTSINFTTMCFIRFIHFAFCRMGSQSSDDPSHNVSHPDGSPADVRPILHLICVFAPLHEILPTLVKP